MNWDSLKSLRRKQAAWGMIGLSLLSGCGRSDAPDVGRVTGVVTLDGAPLPNAMISFTPVHGGRPANGETNADGRYELVFNSRTGGALVGDHSVCIGVARDANIERDQVAVPERVPPRYNIKSELQVTVKSGKNAIDFPLTSR